MTRSKYGAKKILLDDIVFDSKMESDYYIYLKYLKKIGEIKDYELQPEFILQDGFKKGEKKFLPIKYKADFKVFHNDDSIEIVDVKGFTTTDFLLKQKMFHYRYDFKLSLMTFSKIDGGWIEQSDLKKARAARKKAKNNGKKN